MQRGAVVAGRQRAGPKWKTDRNRFHLISNTGAVRTWMVAEGSGRERPVTSPRRPRRMPRYCLLRDQPTNVSHYTFYAIYLIYIILSSYRSGNNN